MLNEFLIVYHVICLLVNCHMLTHQVDGADNFWLQTCCCCSTPAMICDHLDDRCLCNQTFVVGDLIGFYHRNAQASALTLWGLCNSAHRLGESQWLDMYDNAHLLRYQCNEFCHPTCLRNYLALIDRHWNCSNSHKHFHSRLKIFFSGFQSFAVLHSKYFHLGTDHSLQLSLLVS